ncbi:MAG: GNAT family N-acetyltransferase [Candidatus Ornithospirochaeta sp.]
MMTSEELWKKYLESGKQDEKYEAWAFCGGGKEADELLALVKEGKKRGTASSLIAYVTENEEVPAPSAKSIVLDSNNEAHLVIVTRKVTITPFVDVHPYHGYLEGEGNRTLDYWREVHERFFAPDYKESGKEFDPKGEVVLEEFDVIYPPEYEDKDEIYLTLPIKEEEEEYKKYKDEFLSYSSPMDGTGSLSTSTSISEWMERENNMWKEESLPPGFVPSTLLVAKRRSDEKVVGMISLRHFLNDYLLQFGGNIGYSVRPTERGKGYGKKMVELALPYLKALGLMKALITCNDTNEASRKIILYNGGVYENTIECSEGRIERYWIEL